MSGSKAISKAYSRPEIDYVKPDLGERGSAFWEAVVSRFRPNLPEYELLCVACYTLDEIEELNAAISEHGVMTVGSQKQLRANPALAQVRAHREVLARVLAMLGLNEDGRAAVPTPKQLQARGAAQSRWKGHEIGS